MTAFTDRHRTDDPPPTICVDCGERYYSWGSHAEACRGPRPAYRLHQALGRCWCHRCHSMSEAIDLNRALKEEHA